MLQGEVGGGPVEGFRHRLMEGDTGGGLYTVRKHLHSLQPPLALFSPGFVSRSQHGRWLLHMTTPWLSS